MMLRRPFISIFLLATAMSLAPLAFAQEAGFSGNRHDPIMSPTTATPDAMKDIGVDEHLNQSIPLNTILQDEMGRHVTLGQYLSNGKPAILQLQYFGCPMLCDLVSRGMVDTLGGMNLEIGKDFSVFNISFDPRETCSDAFLKKKGYVERYGRPGAAEGWHFLIGPKNSIDAITKSVGFAYKWDEKNQQFAHPAVLMIIMPDGRIAHYLYGVKFKPEDLQASILAAGVGNSTSTTDRVLLFCYHLYSQTGNTLAAMGAMRVGGVLTLLIMGSVLVRLFVREHRANARAVEDK